MTRQQDYSRIAARAVGQLAILEHRSAAVASLKIRISSDTHLTSAYWYFRMEK